MGIGGLQKGEKDMANINRPHSRTKTVAPGTAVVKKGAPVRTPAPVPVRQSKPTVKKRSK